MPDTHISFDDALAALGLQATDLSRQWGLSKRHAAELAKGDTPLFPALADAAARALRDIQAQSAPMSGAEFHDTFRRCGMEKSKLAVSKIWGLGRSMFSHYESDRSAIPDALRTWLRGIDAYLADNPPGFNLGDVDVRRARVLSEEQIDALAQVSTPELRDHVLRGLAPDLAQHWGLSSRQAARVAAGTEPPFPALEVAVQREVAKLRSERRPMSPDEFVLTIKRCHMHQHLIVQPWGYSANMSGHFSTGRTPIPRRMAGWLRRLENYFVFHPARYNPVRRAQGRTAMSRDTPENRAMQRMRHEGEDGRVPTYAEIGDCFGVSRETVRAILSELERIDAAAKASKPPRRRQVKGSASP